MQAVGHASHCLGKQLPADQHAADLARAGTDLVQLRVTPEPAQRVLVDVAVAAKNLHTLAGHPGGLLGGPQDDRGAILAHLAHMLGTQQVEVLGDRVGEAARRLQHGVHVGHLALDELELADALTELLAVVDVGNHVVHHALHDAQRAAGQHGALVVQARHQHLGAVVDAAQHVLGRHLDILEHQLAGVAAAHAELVELLRDAETLHALLDQEGGHTPRAQLRLGLGVDDEGVGVRSVSDPHLAAVEDVVAALVLGAQLHADDVRAGAGFAHRQRADMLAADQLGQVFGALRVIAVALDLVHAQVAVRAVGQAHRRAGAADLLHRHHVGQVAHVGAAVLLGDGDAQHAQLAHLAPQIHRELVAAVDLGGAWRDLGLGKGAHRVAQSVDVFAELEVQAGQSHGESLLSAGSSPGVQRGCQAH
mmetsp:Transcript_26227/g.61964  ORF Transcript_26227/g.61964 Transcript_26227/m.61964 type:complete len:421 (+) Transcript_26227:5135-6397(+)